MANIYVKAAKAGANLALIEQVRAAKGEAALLFSQLKQQAAAEQAAQAAATTAPKIGTKEGGENVADN